MSFRVVMSSHAHRDLGDLGVPETYLNGFQLRAPSVGWDFLLGLERT